MSSGGKSGGGGASKQYNYFASIVAVVGHGPFDGIRQFIVENKVAWDGTLAREGSPAWTPITISGYGQVRIGWGEQTTPDGLLTTYEEPVYDTDPETGYPVGDPIGTQTVCGNDKGHIHPAYTGQIILVFDRFLCGLERTTFPNIEVVGWRKPRQTLITGPAAELDEDRQANPFCVLAELFTNEWFGLGLPDSAFNVESWQAAADKAYQNRAATYVSVLQTSQTSAKQIAANLLTLCDGWLRADRETGACEAGMFTPPEEIDVDSLPVIDNGALIEPPEWTPQTWEDVKTKFTVTFTDRDKNFKSRPSAPYEDQRARINVGCDAPEVLERPQITRAAQADEHAIRYGRRFAIPGNKGKLRPRFERIADVRPGQHVRLDIDPEPGGIQLQQVCRVLSITRQQTGPATMEVEIEPTLQPVEIPAPLPPTPPEPDVEIPDISRVRIFEAPVGMADGKSFVVAILASRPTGVTGFNAYYDKLSDGFFPQVGAGRAFALRGRLNAALAADAGGAIAVELLDELNREIVAEDPGDAAARDDQLLMLVMKDAGNGQIALDSQGKDWIEIFSCEAFVSASTNVINVTSLRSRQGTSARDFGLHDEVWFIRRSALTLIEHADFPTLGAAYAYFKLQPGGAQGARPLEDCETRSFTFATARDQNPDATRYLERRYIRSQLKPDRPEGNTPEGWFLTMDAPTGVGGLWASEAYKYADTGNLAGQWSIPVEIVFDQQIVDGFAKTLSNLIKEAQDHGGAIQTEINERTASITQLQDVVAQKASETALMEEIEQRSDSDQALTQQIQTAITQFNSVIDGKASISALESEQTTRAQADEAEVTARTQAVAQLNDSLAGKAATAYVDQQITALAAIDQTLARTLSKVLASQGDANAAVQVLAEALIDAAGKIIARWGVTVQAGDVITGIEVLSQNGASPVSKIKILANVFEIISQLGGESVTPFEVVDGVTRIKSALIGNASITTLQIAGNAVIVPATASAPGPWWGPASGGSNYDICVLSFYLPQPALALVLSKHHNDYPYGPRYATAQLSVDGVQIDYQQGDAIQQCVVLHNSIQLAAGWHTAKVNVGVTPSMYASGCTLSVFSAMR